MNPEILTHSAQELLQKAIAIAQQRGNPTLLPLHLLAAGLENDFCLSFFNVLKINIPELEMRVAQELGKLPTVQGGQLSSDYTLEDFFKNAEKDAKHLKDDYVGLEHMLLQWVETTHLPESIRSYFKSVGATKQAVLRHMHTIRKGKTVKKTS